MKKLAFFASLMLSAAFLSNAASAADHSVKAAAASRVMSDVTLEVVVSKPKPGVELKDLLAADKAMEQQFVKKQHGFLGRKVAVAKDGSVFVVVQWRTMKDADDAAAKFMTDPSAKARGAISDVSLFEHYVVTH